MKPKPYIFVLVAVILTGALFAIVIGLPKKKELPKPPKYSQLPPLPFEEEEVSTSTPVKVIHPFPADVKYTVFDDPQSAFTFEYPDIWTVSSTANDKTVASAGEAFFEIEGRTVMILAAGDWKFTFRGCSPNDASAYKNYHATLLQSGPYMPNLVGETWLYSTNGQTTTRLEVCGTGVKWESACLNKACTRVRDADIAWANIHWSPGISQFRLLTNSQYASTMSAEAKQNYRILGLMPDNLTYSPTYSPHEYDYDKVSFLKIAQHIAQSIKIKKITDAK